MITRLGMAPRAATLDAAAFQAHWRSSHADVAGRIPGLRAYVQHHAALHGPDAVLAELGHDALSELDFDDVAAMDAGFASDTYREAVRADEDVFIDKPRATYGVYARTVLDERPAPVELLLAWTGPPATVTHDGRHERLDALPDRPAPFTRVDVLGCPDVAAALALAERHPDARRLVGRQVDVRPRGQGRANASGGSPGA